MGEQYKSWRRQRAFRRPGQDYAFKGMIAHVTVCLAKGRPTLRSEELVAVRDTILKASEDPRWEPLAICAMPDHFHLLLQTLTAEISLSKIVKFIKWSYATKSGIEELWQRTFHDHLIRAKEPVENHARYIIENPIKAGLCEDLRMWPGTWIGKGVL